MATGIVRPARRAYFSTPGTWTGTLRNQSGSRAEPEAVPHTTRPSAESRKRTQVERGIAVRRPGVVMIKTLTSLPAPKNRPSSTRYIHTPIRFPTRVNLRFRVLTRRFATCLPCQVESRDSNAASSRTVDAVAQMSDVRCVDHPGLRQVPSNARTVEQRSSDTAMSSSTRAMQRSFSRRGHSTHVDARRTRNSSRPWILNGSWRDGTLPG